MTKYDSLKFLKKQKLEILIPVTIAVRKLKAEKFIIQKALAR